MVNLQTCGRVAIKAGKLQQRFLEYIKRMASSKSEEWVARCVPDMLYVLTNRVSEVLQGGCRMERPPSSKRTATVRRNGIREPVRDGIGVDGEREHQ